MKITRNSVSGVLVAMLIAAMPVLAHHGYSAYDMTRTESRKGTVTVFRLVNPHSQLMFDVKDAAGNIEHWVVETGAPVRGMRAAGATPDTFKPGEVVTVHFNPSLNGAHIGVLAKVEFADGRVFSTGQQAREAGPTP
jgi:hypothetical protein